MTNTYWEDNGKYQKEYDRLTAMLEKDRFFSSSYEGLLLRHAVDLQYDYYNNRNINVVTVNEEPTECEHCDGHGEIPTSNDGTEYDECYYCSGSGLDWTFPIRDYHLSQKGLHHIESLSRDREIREMVYRLESLLTSELYNKFGDEDGDAEALERLYANIISHIIEMIIFD